MNDTTLQPTDVEEKFCKFLDKMDATVPLNGDQFGIFMTLLSIEDREVEELYEKIPPIGYIIKGRLESLKYTLDKKTQLMLSFIVNTPGDAVLYIYYIAYKAKEKNKDIITFDDFVDIFPMGYFSKKQLDEAWEVQKIEGQNLLDYPEASISLNN